MAAKKYPRQETIKKIKEALQELKSKGVPDDGNATVRDMLTELSDDLRELLDMGFSAKLIADTLTGRNIAEVIPRQIVEIKNKFDKNRIARTRGKGKKRAPALLNPIETALKGKDVLVAQLEQLTLDQLHDIVAQYGMDRSRLQRARDKNHVAERIVEIALTRSTKGDAFLEPKEDSHELKNEAAKGLTPAARRRGEN